uniref:Uncharacterized protein n=1 Tax=Heterorhabditis bacteriophora TaxID=37862 RepID=A0A1I7WA08_HETBA
MTVPVVQGPIVDSLLLLCCSLCKIWYFLNFVFSTVLILFIVRMVFNCSLWYFAALFISMFFYRTIQIIVALFFQQPPAYSAAGYFERLLLMLKLNKRKEFITNKIKRTKQKKHITRYYIKNKLNNRKQLLISEIIYISYFLPAAARCSRGLGAGRCSLLLSCFFL